MLANIPSSWKDKLDAAVESSKEQTVAAGNRQEPNNICRSVNRYGRAFSNGRPLSDQLRLQILQLAVSGHRPSEISRKLLVSHGCVSKIISRFRQTGSVNPGQVGGRKSRYLLQAQFLADQLRAKSTENELPKTRHINVTTNESTSEAAQCTMHNESAPSTGNQSTEKREIPPFSSKKLTAIELPSSAVGQRWSCSCGHQQQQRLKMHINHNDSPAPMPVAAGSSKSPAVDSNNKCKKLSPMQNHCSHSGCVHNDCYCFDEHDNGPCDNMQWHASTHQRPVTRLSRIMSADCCRKVGVCHGQKAYAVSTTTSRAVAQSSCFDDNARCSNGDVINQLSRDDEPRMTSRIVENYKRQQPNLDNSELDSLSEAADSRPSPTLGGNVVDFYNGTKNKKTIVVTSTDAATESKKGEPMASSSSLSAAAAVESSAVIDDDETEKQIWHDIDDVKNAVTHKVLKSRPTAAHGSSSQTVSMASMTPDNEVPRSLLASDVKQSLPTSKSPFTVADVDSSATDTGTTMVQKLRGVSCSCCRQHDVVADDEAPSMSSRPLVSDGEMHLIAAPPSIASFHCVQNGKTSSRLAMNGGYDTVLMDVSSSENRDTSNFSDCSFDDEPVNLSVADCVRHSPCPDGEVRCRFLSNAGNNELNSFEAANTPGSRFSGDCGPPAAMASPVTEVLMLNGRHFEIVNVGNGVWMSKVEYELLNHLDNVHNHA